MFRFSGVRGDNIQWDDICACPNWEDPDEAFTVTKEWLVQYFEKHTLHARNAKDAETWLMEGCARPEDDLQTMEPGTNATYRAMFAPCLPFGQEEIQKGFSSTSSVRLATSNAAGSSRSGCLQVQCSPKQTRTYKLLMML